MAAISANERCANWCLDQEAYQSVNGHDYDSVSVQSFSTCNDTVCDSLDVISSVDDYTERQPHHKDSDPTKTQLRAHQPRQSSHDNRLSSNVYPQSTFHPKFSPVPEGRLSISQPLSLYHPNEFTPYNPKVFPPRPTNQQLQSPVTLSQTQPPSEQDLYNQSQHQDPIKSNSSSNKQPPGLLPRPPKHRRPTPPLTPGAQIESFSDSFYVRTDCSSSLLNHKQATTPQTNQFPYPTGGNPDTKPAGQFENHSDSLSFRTECSVPSTNHHQISKPLPPPKPHNNLVNRTKTSAGQFESHSDSLSIRTEYSAPSTNRHKISKPLPPPKPHNNLVNRTKTSAGQFESHSDSLSIRTEFSAPSTNYNKTSKPMLLPKPHNLVNHTKTATGQFESHSDSLSIRTEFSAPSTNYNKTSKPMLLPKPHNNLVNHTKTATGQFESHSDSLSIRTEFSAPSTNYNKTSKPLLPLKPHNIISANHAKKSTGQFESQSDTYSVQSEYLTPTAHPQPSPSLGTQPRPHITRPHIMARPHIALTQTQRSAVVCPARSELTLVDENRQPGQDLHSSYKRFSDDYSVRRGSEYSAVEEMAKDRLTEERPASPRDRKTANSPSKYYRCIRMAILLLTIASLAISCYILYSTLTGQLSPENGDEENMIPQLQRQILQYLNSTSNGTFTVPTTVTPRVITPAEGPALYKHVGIEDDPGSKLVGKRKTTKMKISGSETSEDQKEFDIHSLDIPKRGIYFVYMSLHLVYKENCDLIPAGDLRKTTGGYVILSHHDDDQLLRSEYTCCETCGEDKTTIFTGGLYLLDEGAKLQVEVNYGERVKKGDSTYFGYFLASLPREQ